MGDLDSIISLNMTTTEYQHRTHPRAKRLILRVQADGSVMVTTPKDTAKKTIDKFVTKNQDWIAKQRTKLQQLPKPVTDTTVRLFGQTYQKKLLYAAGEPAGIQLKQNILILNTTAKQTEWGSDADQLLCQFLKETAENYITSKTATLSKQMELDYNNITLREQKTRWGSCSSKGNLNFNWRLVHYDKDIINYVIIHELAHLKHLNHSTEFWGLVAKHDPDHQQHRRFLKKQGMTIG